MKGLQKYSFTPAALIALLSLAIAGFSCSKTHGVPPAEIPAPAKSAGTLPALGGSYTIGQSVGEGDRFPNQSKRHKPNFLQDLA